jgi:hypothetical protein
VFDAALGGVIWPDAKRCDLRWVEEPRKRATGLDSLLTWAYRQGASTIRFQTGQRSGSPFTGATIASHTRVWMRSNSAMSSIIFIVPTAWPGCRR